MSDAARLRLSRSHSARTKSEFETNTIRFTRPKPVFVPKSFSFLRGSANGSRQVSLDENIWIHLSGPLSKILSHENHVIAEYQGIHQIPSAPETCASAFLSEFERQTVSLDDPLQCELLRCFCASFANMFAANVCSYLLYESEVGYADTIKQNPLANSPAMFILRFLYALPGLMKTEPLDTPTALNMQNYLQILIDFATERGSQYFVWPVSPGSKGAAGPKTEAIPRAVHFLNSKS
jgi:hypothetical protein